MSKWIVIENTPGYLPEDDDPGVYDTYEEAKEAQRDLVESLLDDYYADEDANPDAGWDIHTLGDGTDCVYVYRNQDDLGRVVEILPAEEEE